jgi:WD40 repeat protein/tetratricopeptide (TPR) repeat protein
VPPLDLPTRVEPFPDAGPARPVASPVVPGYDLLLELGRGGMGVVYRARHLALKRVVALKMILAGSGAAAEELARFRAEAEAVARLQHPNIVQIYEVSEYNGRPYCALEFVDGGSLADKLAHTPQAARYAAAVVQALARAVHHAHECGIVHRDLKPANVLLTRQGTPKVTDFGLVKRLDDDSGRTRSGAIMGTPSYMAPEQAAGRTREIGPLVDVYALGAILYEMLTGRPPFQGSSVYDTLEQVRTQEPVAPRQLNPAAPRDLETICLKCLQKEPAKRYAGADAMADDLRRFLGGEPIQARPVGAGERLWRWCRRKPALAALAGVSIAAVLVLAGVLLISDARVTKQRDYAIEGWGQANEKAVEARKSEKKAIDARRDAQDKTVRLLVGNGARLHLDGDLGGALPWYVSALREDRDAEEEAEAARREQTHRIRLAAVLGACPRLVHLWPHETPVERAGFSPDGSLVLVATGHGVIVYDTATGEPAFPGLEIDHLKDAAFGPSGRLLMTAAEVLPGPKGEVRLWEASTGRLVRAITLDRSVRRAVLSPDEKRLLIVSGEGTDAREARVWDAVTGQPVSPPVKHEQVAGSGWAAFSPDGRRVLTAAGSEARVWDPATGHVDFTVQQLNFVEQWTRIVFASFTPNGRWVITAGGNNARIWDAATGRPVGTPLTHGGALRVIGAALNPSGENLITVAGGLGDEPGETRVWSMTSGKAWDAPWRLPAVPTRVAFSPDGARVVIADQRGAVQVWHAFGGKPLSPPVWVGGDVTRATFSPDGRFLLAASVTGSARVWDLASVRPASQPLREPPARAYSESSFAWLSPDGQALALAPSSESKGTARVWETASGRPLSPPLPHPTGVGEVVFGPDGLLATCDRRGHARTWDMAAGRLLASPDADGINTVAFVAGGRLLTLNGDGRAALWDPRTGQAAGEGFPCPRGLAETAFSADGRRFATAARAAQGSGRRAAEVRVWDTLTGQPVGPALTVTGTSIHLDLDRDGTRLLALGTTSREDVSEEGEVRLWDVAGGRPLGPPLKVRGGMAALHPNGRFLAAEQGGAAVIVWDAETGEPLTPPLNHDESRLLTIGFAGGELVTVSESASVLDPQPAPPLIRRWDLAPTDLPADALEHLAGLLSGQRVVKGSLTAFTPAEARPAWETLRQQHPGLRVAPPADVLAWQQEAVEWCEAGKSWQLALRHLDALLPTRDDAALRRQRAHAHEELGHWDEGLADADRAVALAPGELASWEDRGRLRARSGRYKEAAADFRKCIELVPDSVRAWMDLPLVCLAGGDAAGYRAACTALYVRYGQGDHHEQFLCNILLTCCVGPGALDDPEKVIAFAEAIGKRAPNNFHPRFLRGAALYRAGRIEAAAACLNEALRTHDPNYKPSEWTFLAILALVHARVGKADDAKRLLDQVNIIIEEGAHGQWESRLVFRLLRQETEGLLAGKKP